MVMVMRITTLSENTADKSDTIGEWGLSILVETEDSNVLFDTGKANSAAHNADALGIDLHSIDKIVLSHGHYDHTGGLRDVLRKVGKEIEVIAHEDIWQSKYACEEGMPDRYIGIPFQREELEYHGARFNLVSQPVKIGKYIMTTGEVPMVCDFEKIAPGLFVKENDRMKPDIFRDDLALILNTDQGLVVILGCAHRGMINTIYHARKLTGVDKIRAVIGGSHLMSATEEQLWQSIAALHEINIQTLGLCHCTDMPAISVLANEFGERFIFNKAGSVVEFE